MNIVPNISVSFADTCLYCGGEMAILDVERDVSNPLIATYPKHSLNGEWVTLKACVECGSVRVFKG